MKKIYLNPAWKFASFSKIHSDCALLFKASSNRNNRIVAVNAGHGTNGGDKVRTYCHPDKTPNITGGSVINYIKCFSWRKALLLYLSHRP